MLLLLNLSDEPLIKEKKQGQVHLVVSETGPVPILSTAGDGSPMASLRDSVVFLATWPGVGTPGYRMSSLRDFICGTLQRCTT